MERALKDPRQSHTDGSSFIARYEKLRREEILSGNPQGTPLGKLSWTWELEAQEQGQPQDGPSDRTEPLSLQTAADETVAEESATEEAAMEEATAEEATAEEATAEEAATIEQSVWSSYAQAHHVLIADPATFEVLQGVPAAPKGNGPRDPNPIDADLQARKDGEDVVTEEPPLEDGWQDLPLPIDREVPMPEAATDAGRQKHAPQRLTGDTNPSAAAYEPRSTRGMGDVSTNCEIPRQTEQQDSRDWSEVEAVLVAEAASVEEATAETTERDLEEAVAGGELLQTPELVGSRLAPPHVIHGTINGPMVSFAPWALGRFVGLTGQTMAPENATFADFAEVITRLSREGMGAWDLALTNSFAMNAINGLSPDKDAATFQRETAPQDPLVRK